MEGLAAKTLGDNLVICILGGKCIAEKIQIWL